MLALIGWLDYITGSELSFFIFYFLPITLVAWFISRGPAMLVACLCTSEWFLVEQLTVSHGSGLGFHVWNASIRGFTFLLIAILIARIRGALETEQRLNAVLTAQLQQVQGLLPICAWCKRIRNDHGYWEQVEEYFRNSTGIEFTHGICPECRKKFHSERKDQPNPR